MELVCIASPWAGGSTEIDGQRFSHKEYARQAMLHAIAQKEAPFVPHLLYPQVLDDTNSKDREFGVRAALAYLRNSHRLAVYWDLGISAGMQTEILFAEEWNIPIEHRKVPGFLKPAATKADFSLKLGDLNA